MPDEVKPNPLALDQLRDSADYTTQVAVRKRQLTVPVRKPHKSEWIRVRQGEDYRLTLRLFVTRDKSYYAVAPSMRDELDGHLRQFMLVTCITKPGDVILWPLAVPDDNDTTGSSWHRSAIRAARAAEGSWVCVVANMSLGSYELREPRDSFPDPLWPEESLQELIERAFAHQLIDGPDHPLVKEIEGRI